MDISAFTFVVKNVRPEEIKDKYILEVGACDVNGSVRPFIEIFQPKKIRWH